MPAEPLCCPVAHVTVRSCFLEGPVQGAFVEVLDTPIDGYTDDTGTVTMLLEEPGTYLIRALYNEGAKVVTAEIACGVNNVEIHFGLTDKICFEVSKPGNLPIDDMTLTVTDANDVEVGTCAVSAASSRCCVTIPGPGTYAISGGNVGTELPEEVVIGPEDCGDRIVPVSQIGEAETCERTLHFALCGCPATGVGITVALGGGYTVAGTVNASGVAVFVVNADRCDDFVGGEYTVDLPGTSATLTGTVTADGMTIPDPNPGTTWCHPDCAGNRPSSLYWTFGSGWGAPLAGRSMALSSNGANTWVGTTSGMCSDFSMWFASVGVEIPRARLNCTDPPAGTLSVQLQITDGTCLAEGYTSSTQSFPLTGDAGELYCPVNLSVGNGTLTE